MSVSVSPHGLAAMIEAGRPPAIYDLRTPQQFAADHVPGSVHTRGTSAVALAAGTSRGSMVVMVCEDGRRSREMAEAASQRCTRKIGWLDGGMAAWAHDRPRIAVRVVDDLQVRGDVPRPRPAPRASVPKPGVLGLVASWFNLPVAAAALVGTAVIVAAAVRLFMWE